MAAFISKLDALQLGNKGFGDAVTFDNAYYPALLKKPWMDAKDTMGSMVGLPSDRVLADDPLCVPYITLYARDQQKWFEDFNSAFLKLSQLGAIWT